MRKTCQIVPFRGFGTPSAIHVSGRVLERRPRSRNAKEERGAWARLRAIHDRFETDEIAGVSVRVATAEGGVDVTTDEEGHFQALLGLPTPLPSAAAWHHVHVWLTHDPTVRAATEVIVPQKARYGIISDIDDTIVSTKAYHPIAKFRRIFLTDARARVPFPGVPELYRALVSRTEQNPIFYVSSSPWNLHEVFVDAFAMYGVPRGPMFFKDFGLAPGKFVKISHDEHKLRWISLVMDTYPNLPFVLFGDTGQRDAVIYAEIGRRYPDRLLAVYLREVKKHTPEVAQGLSELRAQGVQALSFAHSDEAARHAALRGITMPG